MPSILDPALVLEKLSSLPLEVHQPGDVVLAAGTTTGKLLILKQGVVEVVRDGVRLAEVSTPGAVFGELAVLLGQPHTADVRALQPSSFHVAHGQTFLQVNPTAALYVAVILAERLDFGESLSGRGPEPAPPDRARRHARPDARQHRPGAPLRPAVLNGSLPMTIAAGL